MWFYKDFKDNGERPHNVCEMALFFCPSKTNPMDIQIGEVKATNGSVDFPI